MKNSSWKKCVEDYRHEIADLNPKFRAKQLILTENTFGAKIKLASMDLEDISKKRAPNSDNIRFYPYCGFSAGGYSEFFIDLKTDFIYQTDNDLSVNLAFNIESYELEFGHVSDIFAFLYEPYYSTLHYIEDRGLQEYYYTLKIRNRKKHDPLHGLHSGLFYLNTHYLKPVKIPAAVMHLNPEDKSMDALANEENFKKISRVRTRERKAFRNMEPVLLFNYAATQTGENRFLAFYRVLEYFMDQNFSNHLTHLRYDPSITINQISDEIRQRNEKRMLDLLLRALHPQSARCRNLFEYIVARHLSQENRQISQDLYNFRNSLVHAKESQMDRTRIPTLIMQDNTLLSWNYAVEQLAELCIHTLNHT